jgi:2-(1,2-epoxy-1,2-dihydrophenyl)acetyl-CoA isomerase
LLLESVANKLETQMALETDWITQMARTRDGREGIEAFVGKRTPQFKAE